MHPDMRIVDSRGNSCISFAGNATPQGALIHCYDHPAWREHGGALLRHVVSRYRDRPNMLVWGLWDGIYLPCPGGLPCYCRHTLARYKDWLRRQFDLDELNQRFLRRYRTWEDVEPPRSNANAVEMLMFRRFLYENLVDQLKWMVKGARDLDPEHEMRAHCGWTPRPWDEQCAPHVDSWGMSMSSNNLLTSRDPASIAERAFSFDWARSVARNGRWWNEEIYAGMSPGGVTWHKQSDPRETNALLWLTLIGGAAGAMYWQYRPEYLSFESPGYNLTAPDGEPTDRMQATTRAIQQIEGLSDHLPLVCPQPEVGVVYHSESQELFGFDDQGERFVADMHGIYRTLWTNGIPTDVISPRMDWSGYRLLFLPNVALMDDVTRKRITDSLDENPELHLVAAGSFGMYSADGQTSYRPPEGFDDKFDLRVADFSAVTEFDIEQGRNVIETTHGSAAITSPCGYAVLEPKDQTQAIASLNGQTVGVRTVDGRFTWLGFSLSAGFGNASHPDITLGLADALGIAGPVAIEGDHVVPVVRRSRKGGWLIFVLNLEHKTARARLRPRFQIEGAHDLLSGSELSITENAFELEIPSWEIAVTYCTEDK